MTRRDQDREQSHDRAAASRDRRRSGCLAQERPAPQYFALIATGGNADAATGLVRRTHSTPMFTDEELRGDFTWHPTDYLQRYHYLGSNDQGHVEITQQFAERLMDRWREHREDQLSARREAGA